MSDLQLYIILIILFILIIGSYTLTNMTLSKSINDEILKLSNVDIKSLADLSKLNTNFEAYIRRNDTAVGLKADKSNITQVTNTFNNNLALKATIEELNNKFNNITNIIVIWSGNLAELPVGWVLCDGSRYFKGNYPTASLRFTKIDLNAGDIQTDYIITTPDLRSRCVIGSGIAPEGAIKDVTSYNEPTMAANGLKYRQQSTFAGAEDTTLTVGQIPYHNHYGFITPRLKAEVSTYIGNNNYGSGDNKWHALATKNPRINLGNYALSTGIAGDNSQNYTILGEATPGIDGSTWAGKTSFEGKGESHTNMQPWYALAYIMKIF